MAKRRNFSPDFKARVALAAIRGRALGHPIYPYLLWELTVARANQVGVRI